MQKLHKNTFTKGIDSDTTLENLSSSNYRDALGVTVTSDGEYSTVKVRKSDESVAELNFDESIIKITRCKYKEGFNLIESLVLFSVKSDIVGLGTTEYTMNIYIYNQGTATLIASYFLGDNFTEGVNREDMFIDCVLFTERGTDTLYFTDGITEPKKLILDKSIVDNGSGELDEENNLPQI